MKQTFRKEERLRHKQLIGDLFRNGQSYFSHPLKMTWMEIPASLESPVQVLMVVPKHHIRNASDRNLVRRRMREAYRMNKETLYHWKGKSPGGLCIAFQYMAKKPESFAIIQDKIILLLHRFTREHGQERNT